MTDTITDLEATSIRDQVDAHWCTVSEATARHYTTLVTAGISDKAAVKLTRDYQGMLLAGEPEVTVFVGEGYA